MPRTRILGRRSCRNVWRTSESGRELTTATAGIGGRGDGYRRQALAATPAAPEMASSRSPRDHPDGDLRARAVRFFSFGLSRHPDANARLPLAMAAGGHVDPVHLRHFYRRRRWQPGATIISISRRLPRRCTERRASSSRLMIRADGLRRRRLPHLFRLHQFSSRVRQLPIAVRTRRLRRFMRQFLCAGCWSRCSPSSKWSTDAATALIILSRRKSRSAGAPIGLSASDGRPLRDAHRSSSGRCRFAFCRSDISAYRSPFRCWLVFLSGRC